MTRWYKAHGYYEFSSGLNVKRVEALSPVPSIDEEAEAAEGRLAFLYDHLGNPPGDLAAEPTKEIRKLIRAAIESARARSRIILPEYRERQNAAVVAAAARLHLARGEAADPSTGTRKSGDRKVSPALTKKCSQRGVGRRTNIERAEDQTDAGIQTKIQMRVIDQLINKATALALHGKPKWKAAYDQLMTTGSFTAALDESCLPKGKALLKRAQRQFSARTQIGLGNGN